MTDAAIPSDQNSTANQPEQGEAICRRCGARGPVGDDGFCAKCEKALEQACL